MTVERAACKWSKRVYIVNAGAGRFYSLIPFLARLRMASTSSPTHLIPTCVTHLPIFSSFDSLWTPQFSSANAVDGTANDPLGWATFPFPTKCSLLGRVYMWRRSSFILDLGSLSALTLAPAPPLPQPQVSSSLPIPAPSHSSTLFSTTSPTENRGSLYTINTIVESRRHQLCSPIANPDDQAPRSAYGWNTALSYVMPLPAYPTITVLMFFW